MKFRIPIEVDPSQVAACMSIADLHDAVNQACDRHGEKQCATLGQIHTYGDAVVLIEGRLFSGKAFEHLCAAIAQAEKIQNEIEADERAHPATEGREVVESNGESD